MDSTQVGQAHTPLAYADFTARCHVCGVLCEYEGGQRKDDRCRHQAGQVYEVEPTEGDVDWLVACSDHNFQAIVSTDAKGEQFQTVSAALRHDDVLDRWDEALTGLYTVVTSQLAARKGETDAETRSWRHAALRFQSSVLTRKKECKALITARNIEEEKARAGTNRATRKVGKEARKAAADRAIDRLLRTYPAHFARLLIEEHEADGLPIKEQWVTVSRATNMGGSPVPPPIPSERQADDDIRP